jgi:hypothetical protein
MKKITLLLLGTITIVLQAQNSRTWGTYYGSNRSSYGYSIAHDGAGNIYLAGYTNDTTPGIMASGGFQNTYGGGTNDAYLAKFDAAGNRLWATYYGGTGDDQAYGVCTDSQGNVYLTGYTGSNAGIASGGFQNTYGGGTYDAFLVKFDGAGNRIWSTYYGGNRSSYGQSVAVDASGNIYMEGYTSDTLTGSIASGGFQNTNSGGTYDAFVAKFDASGNRVWGTYYGGTGSDQGQCMTLDASKNVYLAGFTSSNNNISFNGHQNTYGGGTDAFLVKFDSAGVRKWATYYGGTGTDEGRSIAAGAGHIYLSGRSGSNSAIASGGFQNTYGGGTYDAFLVKFDTSGARKWATYYGGSGSDAGYGLAVDGMENIYQSGRTASSANIASGGFQTAFGGNVDAMLVKFDSSGARLCATYYGGSGNNTGDFSFSATIANGRVYIGGYTDSNSGIGSGGFQNTFGGNVDAMLVKFNSCLDISFTPTATTCGNSCDGTALASGNGATLLPYSYIWSTTPAQTTQTATGLCAGTYTLTITDANGNTGMDTVMIIAPPPIVATTTSNNATCGTPDGDATVTASSGNAPYTYLWSPSGQTSQTATGLLAGIYTVTVTDANGCTQTATAIVNNNNAQVVILQSQADVTCFGGNNGTATMSVTGGNAPYTFSWTPAGGSTATGTGLSAGTYTCIVTDANGCIAAQSVTIAAPPPISLNMSNPLTICSGQNANVSTTASGGTPGYTYLWSNGATTASFTDNPASNTTYSVTVTDANGCTSAGTVTITVNPVPNPSITGSTLLCVGSGPVTLTGSGGNSYSWSPGGATTSAISVNPVSTTTYTLIASNGTCTASATHIVTVSTPPSDNVISTPSSCQTCPDGSVAVFGIGNGPLAYNWSPGGATTQIVNGLLPGTYTVCITDANGCSTCDSVLVGFGNGIYSPVSGIGALVIYPNPFSSETTVELKGFSGTAEVRVLDVLGKEVKTLVVRQADRFTLTRDDLDAGIYLMEVLSEGQLMGTGKLIIE